MLSLMYNHITRKLSALPSHSWQSVIGLEVHAQINSKSKLFSGADTSFSSPVNDNVSLFDCSIPGTLPVLNKKCVESGVLTALALNCRINPVSCFDRKHYFYADLPAGYQITQQRFPLAVDGKLDFQVFSHGTNKLPNAVQVRIKQLQLEQDSGKSLHDSDRSLVDLNRAGAPLMELVFEPDLTNGDEAAAMLKELVAILSRIDTCSCKMEEGALRVDANISIRRENEPLGTRTEIKNIGSIRGVAGAIEYEIKRQVAVREAGGEVVNETRSWDSVARRTVPMRDKEVQQDYRYMPEPNLPPLHVAMGPIQTGSVNADELQRLIPELPEETRHRLRVEKGLNLEQSIILVNDDSLLKIFQRIVGCGQVENKKLLANFLINDFITLLNKIEKDTCEVEESAEYLGEIVELLEKGHINRTTAKFLLEEILSENNKHSPMEIVRKKDLIQITDEKELTAFCEKVILENEKVVQAYKSGKTKVFKALLGSVAKLSKNKADMAKCTVILKRLLDE
ncbi:unnamed protein product [Phaedon cochleariae]|uniref:Glutamyl-tRNA(Gln) amidotransferase subunit B, mitochondrial n=1 Tax=Phaedon cochleariae TaxID=80249 RepID=A0A9N9X6J5_PHACE|nr:unnamed protein product [Phaedon cochleariae]